jgi:hypothetical protein
MGLDWETRAPLLLRGNNRKDLGPPRLAHLRAHEYVKFRYLPQEMFDSYFSFAFVRNPWSRLVSIYKYKRYYLSSDFKNFVMNLRESGIWREDYWFIGPQAEFVCDRGGNFLVDFIGRMEYFQSHFDYVCEQIGIPHTTLPHQNRSAVEAPRLGPSVKQLRDFIFYHAKGSKPPAYRDFRDYYDNESKDYVAELYRQDIERFGYTFELTQAVESTPVYRRQTRASLPESGYAAGRRDMETE